MYLLTLVTHESNKDVRRYPPIWCWFTPVGHRAIGLQTWRTSVLLISLPLSTHSSAHFFKMSSAIAPQHSQQHRYTFILLCQQTQGEQNVPKPSHKFRSRKFESQGNLLIWLSVGTYIQEPIIFTPWPFCFLPSQNHRIIGLCPQKL